MAKKAKTVFPVSPPLAKMFEDAREMMSNADMYMQRCRHISELAWSQFRADNPNSDPGMPYQYNHDTRTVTKVPEKK